jgi:hypothetical protein
MQKRPPEWRVHDSRARFAADQEAVMNDTESDASLPVAVIRKLIRLSRFILFLCTAGWAFPHVCTEGMDLTRIQNEHMARRK